MSKLLKKTVAVTTTVTTMLSLSGVSLFAPVFVAVAASHIADGDVMKTADNFDVYITKHVGSKKFKRLILNPQVFESYGHLDWADVKTVSQADMDAYTTSDLVRAVDDPKVYKLSSAPNSDTGQRQWVNMTSAEFVAEGFDWDAIYEINATDRDNYTTSSDVVPGGVVPTGAGVSVSLAASSPAAAGVAQGASNVVFTRLDFVGGTDNNTITSITVTRSGLAADADISDVKLWDGVMQLGSTQALNTVTHKAVFTGLSWVVPSGSTKVLTITASIATGPQIGNSPRFGVGAAADVVGASSVNGTFPVSGNGMTIAGVSVGILDVTLRAIPANNNPISGSTDQEIASWKFDALNEGMSVTRIMLTQTGSAANADISNIMLKIGGVQIGSTVSALALDGTATFDLSSAPVVINDGTNKIVYAHADIAAGITTSRTVQFEITNAADVTAFGSNSGGSVVATNDNNVTFTAQAGVAQTISQGTVLAVTLNGATNPSAQTFVRGASQVLVSAFRFSAGAGEDQRVSRIRLTLYGTSTSAVDISNITLYSYDVLTGTETMVGTPTSFVGSTATYGANTSGLDSGVFDVPENGNVVIHVRGDVSSSASWTVLGIAVNEVRVDGIQSQGDIGAATITAVDATDGTESTQHNAHATFGALTIAASPSTPAAQNVVPGTSGFEFAKFDLTMASEAATLSSLTLNLCDDGTVVCVLGDPGTAESGDFTNVKLWDGSTLLGTVATPGAAASFSVNLNLPKDTTVTLSVTADVPTTAIAVWFASSTSVGLNADDLTLTGVSSNATITVPGADVVGNLMTAAVETLTVAFQALPTATVVVNASQVVVSKIVLTAGNVGDVRVASLTFTADDDSALNGDSLASAGLGSLTLYDGATVIAGPKSLTDGGGSADTIVFSGLNLLVQKGTQKLLELKANALVGGGTGFYVGFLDLDATGGTDVVGTGALSNTTIDGTGTDADDSGQLTISTAGTLTVSVDAATPDAALLAVGATGVTGVDFAKFKFISVNEPVDMETLVVTLPTNDDTGSDNGVLNFASLQFFDGATPVSAKVFPTGDNGTASTTFSFTFSPLFRITTVGKVITLRADMNGTDTGANSTTTPQFHIADVADLTDGINSSITARGVDSGARVTSSAGTPNPEGIANTNELTIVKTKPTFALCTASTCSKASPSGALTPGVMEVLRFKITADAGGDVLFDGSAHNILFTMASATTTVTDLQLFDNANDNQLGSTVASPSVNDFDVNDLTLTIPAGGSKELYVKADLTNHTTVGDGFRLDINTDATDLSWGDSVTGDISSTLTDGLPLTGGTLVR